LKRVEFARKHKRPYLHLNQLTGEVEVAGKVVEFIKTHNVTVLNVAGSRASKEPAVYQFVHVHSP